MITSVEMKKLELAAQEHGLTPEHLMENAGREIFNVIKYQFGFNKKHVVIFCGEGNNGGDGFVIAQHCAQECPVLVLFFGAEEKLSDEALQQYHKIKKKVSIIQIRDSHDLAQFHFQPSISYIFIDALIGTGIKGPIREPIRTGVTLFNNPPVVKIAVDVPSGLNPDTGEVQDIVCQPDLIVCLHDLKPGLETMKPKFDSLPINSTEKLN